jgi:hypothetical protein
MNAPAPRETDSKKVMRVSRLPSNALELTNYYLTLAYRIENRISTTRLPSLFISLALVIFASGTILRVFESIWFKGAEFIGFTVFATALLASAVAVHIAELDMPRMDNNADLIKQASIAGQNGTSTEDKNVTQGTQSSE